jgi:hypothetical protein
VETTQTIAALLEPPTTPKRPTQIQPSTVPATKSSSSTAKPSRSALLATLDHATLTASPVDLHDAAAALKTLAQDWTAVDSASARRLVATISDMRKACVECWAGKDIEEKDEGRKDAVRVMVNAMVECTEVSQQPTYPSPSFGRGLILFFKETRLPARNRS